MSIFISAFRACVIFTFIWGSAKLAAEPIDLVEVANSFSKKLDFPFARISPNGKLLATSIMSDGAYQLVLLNRETGNVNAVRLYGDIMDAQFITEDLILVSAYDIEINPQVYLIGKDFSVKPIKGIVDRASSFGAVLEISRPKAYSDNGIRLLLKRANGTQEQMIFNINDQSIRINTGFTHPLDREVDGLPAGVRILEEWEGIKYQINLYKGENKKTLFSGERFIKDASSILGAIGDGSVYVTRSKDGFSSLWTYDYVQEKYEKELLSHAEYDVDAVPFYFPYEKDVLGFVYHLEKPRIFYVDKSIEAIMKDVDLALTETVNIPISASENRDYIVVHAYSDRVAGEYFLLDAKNKKLTPLFARAEWLKPASLSSMEPITYKSRDDFVIHGYLTRPVNASKDAPLIVLPHGGPHVRDVWGFDAEAQFFSALGYAVFQPNFRMSTGYGAEHTIRGLGEVGSKIQQDIYDGIEHMQSLGYGKNGRVCFYGGSFGGYASAKALIDQPRAFRCAIAVAAFYDIPSLLYSDKKKSFYPIMEAIYGNLEQDLERLSDNSITQNADKIEAPIMVVHGALDSRIDLVQAHEFIQALKEHQKEYLAYVRLDEGHGFHKSTNQRNLLLLTAEFLSQHLPVDPAASTNKSLNDSNRLRNQQADRALTSYLEKMEKSGSKRKCEIQKGTNIRKCKG